MLGTWFLGGSLVRRFMQLTSVRSISSVLRPQLAASGLPVAWGEIPSIIALLLMAWVVYPRLYRHLESPIDFWLRRYGSRVRMLFACITVCLYVLVKLSVGVYSGVVVLSYVTVSSPYLAAVGLLAVSGVLASCGGLHGIVVTDVLLTGTMLAGAVCTLIFGLRLIATADDPLGVHAVIAAVPERHFKLFQTGPGASFPWPGALFVQPLISLWYWVVDPMMVQRVHAARSPSDATAGCVLGAALKLTVIPLFALPGLVARAAFPRLIVASPNLAYPVLVSRALPAGLVGLVIAGMCAALVSSVAAALQSVAAIVAGDIVRPWLVQRQQRQREITAAIDSNAAACPPKSGSGSSTNSGSDEPDSTLTTTTIDNRRFGRPSDDSFERHEGASDGEGGHQAFIREHTTTVNNGVLGTLPLKGRASGWASRRPAGPETVDVCKLAPKVSSDVELCAPLEEEEKKEGTYLELDACGRGSGSSMSVLPIVAIAAADTLTVQMDQRLVLLGRLVACVLSVVAVGMVPLVPRIRPEVYLYTHSVMAYVAIPIAVVWALGVVTEGHDARAGTHHRMSWRRRSTKSQQPHQPDSDVAFSGLGGVLEMSERARGNPEIPGEVPRVDDIADPNQVPQRVQLPAEDPVRICRADLSEDDDCDRKQDLTRDSVSDARSLQHHHKRSRFRCRSRALHGSIFSQWPRGIDALDRCWRDVQQAAFVTPAGAALALVVAALIAMLRLVGEVVLESS